MMARLIVKSPYIQCGKQNARGYLCYISTREWVWRSSRMTVRPPRLITLALEEHWKQVQQTDGYLKHIATRPRAERLGDHGLFSDADYVSLSAAMPELEHDTGNVWTHILSLYREDAERLGYNNAQAG